MDEREGNGIMNNEKTKEIVSFNVAAWRWRSTNEPYQNRLARCFDFIRRNAPDAFLIGLQEMIVGEKYYTLLQEKFPEYKIILPRGYSLSKNKCSAINVLLIRSADLKGDCPAGNLEGLEEIAFLYNYVTISTEFGCYRVVNLKVPQTVYNANKAPWYRERRKVLKKEFMDELVKMARAYSNEPDVRLMILGDFNCAADDLNFQYMQNFMLDAEKTRKATWRNTESGCEQCLDHILFSTGLMAADDVKGVCYTEVLDKTIDEGMSDHAMLKGSFRVEMGEVNTCHPTENLPNIRF